MESFSMRIIFDRKGESKTNKNKKYLVQIEVYDRAHRKKIYLSSGVKILPNQYSSNAGFSIVNHPNAALLKRKVHDMYNLIEAYINSDKCLSLEDVKNWDNTKIASQSVIDFIITQHATESPDDNHGDYTSFLTRLIEYGKILQFRDLTYENIEGFDKHLRKKITSQPTLYKRHSKFNHFIEIAIKKHLCTYNPYADYKVKRGKHKDPKFLQEDQITELLNYDPSGSIIAVMPIVKDLFVFQCFTGLPYKDMQEFEKGDVVKVEGGYKAIRSNRIKTDESFVTLLLPEAEAIAEKYNYKLPRISIQDYNKYLKTLAASIGVNIALTSHMARHTFATYLINKGIPIESISKALGHTNTKQSMRYAHILGNKVINDMKGLLKDK